MIVLDEEIIQAVKCELGNFNQNSFGEQDLEKVEKLALNNRTFAGENKNINLYNLDFFSNLKMLSLQYFEINDDIVNLINSCNNLKELQLYSCYCNFNVELKIDRLESILFNCCNGVDYSKINTPRIVGVIGDTNFNLSKLNNKQKVQSLTLQNCEIKGFKTINEFERIVILNLDGSVVDDLKTLDNITTKVKSFSKLDKYLPIR